MTDAATRDAEAILRRMDEGLDDALVPPALFNDPTIHGFELRRIFGRCWVFVGHESEIAEPGDFRLRRIGHDSFIFVRDRSGGIRVLFNACRHRGAMVCRTDAGNAKHFRCPYHSWTYTNGGELVAVPARQEAYQGLDLGEWGLLSAPRVDTYQGLVFASLDAGAPSLPDYLGKFRWYLDMQLILTAGGMEVLGEPHRWRIDADWKTGAENFTGDSSHTHMTHRSLLRLGLAGEAAAGRAGSGHGVHVNDLDGHGISIRLVGSGEESWFGYPPDLQRHIAEGPLSPEQIDLVRRGVVHDATIFPNFSFIHFGGMLDAERPPAGFLAMRVWQPVGPGRMEVWNWVLVPREASAEYKELAYRAAMTTFSPSGNFEQDDANVWSGIAASAASVFVRTSGMRLNYQMGMPGMSDAVPMPDWPGPGCAWPSNAGESGLRSFHRAWMAHMRSTTAEGEG